MIVSHPPNYAEELRELNEISEVEEVPGEAAALLSRLVRDRGFLASEVLPHLGEGRAARGWYVAARTEYGPASLQVFVWPPGSGTRIHDHSSWGVFCCASGAVVEERYTRLDDGSRPEHARLGRAWRLRWGEGDGASTLLPGDGGIHRLSNPHEGVAVTVHLYGPPVGGLDGRDYDPSRDYVCDRTEPDPHPGQDGASQVQRPGEKRRYDR